METRPQSPLFAKTYDFLLWLLPVTLRFPKSQRFLLAERLGKMALDFYDLIMEIAMQPETQIDQLDQANRQLTSIRLYLRLSYDLGCLSPGQYEHAARSMEEIGRLVGGWRRKRAGRPNSPGVTQEASSTAPAAARGDRP